MPDPVDESGGEQGDGVDEPGAGGRTARAGSAGSSTASQRPESPRSEAAACAEYVESEPLEHGAPDGTSPLDEEHDLGAGMEDDHGWTEEVETTYASTATGHRVTRRKVRRKTDIHTERIEVETDEVITDNYPVKIYGAPVAPMVEFPAPVG